MNLFPILFLGLGIALLLNYWYIVLTREGMPDQQKLWLGILNHAVAAVAVYWAWRHYMFLR